MATKKKLQLSEAIYAWLLLLPATLVLFSIRVVPLVQGIIYGFTDKALQKKDVTNFVGIANYITAVHDEEFIQAFWFTFVYTIATVIFSYLVGLGIALLMNMNIRGRNVIRTLLLIPWVVPSSVSAYIWKYALNEQYGIFNAILHNMHLITKPLAFLADKNWARFSVIVVSVWRNYPFMALVILAALSNVPEELKDAALVDGASRFQAFWHVTLPHLKTVTLMSTTLMFIWTFNSFDSIFLLTIGGPAGATMIMSIRAYYAAFQRGTVGLASAMCTIMLVFMTIVSVLYIRLLNGDRKEE